ncbi:MAG: alpha/beta hydrolase domain-containing protein [Pseudomonadota bacterium]
MMTCQRPRARWVGLALLVAAASLAAGSAAARVLEIEIDTTWEVPRVPGATHPDYVVDVGRVQFGVDPNLPANRAVIDIDRAPRDADGLVRSTADLVILRPRDPEEGARSCLMEVSNRGGKALLRYFNAGARGPISPDSPEIFGDGLLMELGFTIIWVGWQADVPREPGRLRLDVPVATENGRPIGGLVRTDWVVDQRVDRLALGHRGHVAYPVVEPDDVRNVLTRRAGRDAPRNVVPRSRWYFGTQQDIRARGVFDPGFIYELVYRSRDPRIMGLGFTAVRDMASYAKYADDRRFQAKHCLGFGVSQTGRFLRHFLYEGFNGDELGRRAFDGLLIHTAGAGRGSFNHRFAQPSRDGHRYSSFYYPTDVFPFTSAEEKDPITGREDGLLGTYVDTDLAPRILYTNTGYEYYARAASLIHTSADGRRDVDAPDNERIYLLASGQHFVDSWPPAVSTDRVAARGNPVDFLVNLRALMVALSSWVQNDVAPPPSLYPRLVGGSLVSVTKLDFPYIPGVLRPEVVHTPARLDFGRRWAEGVALRQPPTVSDPYPVFVPQVDRFGNEFAGVRNVELRAPLATYTPWSFRDGLANPSELADFRGLFVPLQLDTAAATEAGDERPAVGEIYTSRAAYVARVDTAIEALVSERFLLPRDRSRVRQRALATWDLVVGAQGLVEEESQAANTQQTEPTSR